MPPTLLLIEDDPISQELIRALCESRGFAVDAASDGFTGLRMLRDGAYAAALVDYHLPEMDGYALARLMRDLARQGPGPLALVAITADRFGLAARRGSDGLFDAVLPKPLDPDALFATLDRLTGAGAPLRRAAEALAEAPDLDRARSFAEGLWRRHGLAGRPRALVRPAPNGATRAALAHVFDVVDDPAAADLALLLRPAEGALPDALRVADPQGGADDGVVFEVGDATSWARVADAVRGFRADRPPVAAGPGEVAPVAARPGARILVVERAPEAHAALCAMLAEAGHAPRPAATLIEAVTALDAEPVDVVLLGTAAPGVEGAAAAALLAVLRGPASGDGPPVLTLTPSWDLQGETRAELLGAVEAAAERSRRVAIPLVDEATHAAVRAMLGDTEAAALSERLLTGLDADFADGADPIVLAGRAHAAVSAAGMLGFSRLSTAARALEAAIASGRPYPNQLDDARTAQRETRRAFKGLGLTRSA